MKTERTELSGLDSVRPTFTTDTNQLSLKSRILAELPGSHGRISKR